MATKNPNFIGVIKMEINKNFNDERKKILEKFNKITESFRKNIDAICDKHIKILDKKEN